MAKSASITKLEKEKAKLLQEQRQLIHRLKKEYRPAFDWFVSKGIDFGNLHKQTANFSAAVTLFVTSVLHKQPTIATEPMEPVVVQEQLTAKSVKTDYERAQHIWSQYGPMIRASAAEYGVDPNLIFATIMIESGGNPKAIRQEPRLHDASYGLGQLLYGTARGLGYRGTPEGLYDPATNIDLIARYHRRNLDKYGHLTAQQLTTAYNTGSPFKKPLAGHLNKFNKWYNRVENLEFDLT